jgi:hypothetical protein
MPLEVPLTLSQTELIELSGYRRAAEQIRWLTQAGIEFFIGRDGRPRVIRAALVHSISSPAKRTPQVRI